MLATSLFCYRQPVFYRAVPLRFLISHGRRREQFREPPSREKVNERFMRRSSSALLSGRTGSGEHQAQQTRDGQQDRLWFGDENANYRSASQQGVGADHSVTVLGLGVHKYLAIQQVGVVQPKLNHGSGKIARFALQQEQHFLAVFERHRVHRNKCESIIINQAIQRIVVKCVQLQIESVHIADGQRDELTGRVESVDESKPKTNPNLVIKLNSIVAGNRGRGDAGDRLIPSVKTHIAGRSSSLRQGPQPERRPRSNPTRPAPSRRGARR